MSKSNYGWRYLMVAALTMVAPAFAQVADLSIKVEPADPDAKQVPYNSTAAFTVTVTNAGPGSAAGVKVTAASPTTATIKGFSGDCVPLSKDGGLPKDPAVCEVLLSDGGTVIPADGTATFKYTVEYPEFDLESCPAADTLKADVTTTSNDTVTGNNTASLNDILLPVADISGTAESDAPMVDDGGVPPKRYLPGDMVTLKGTVKNNGPCAVPADSITIDTIADSLGLDGEDGSGICDTWTGGACTIPMTLDPGQQLDFEVTRTIQPLTDAGGGSIIQSAAYWNFAIDYAGNVGAGDTAPTTVIMVKGPAAGACAVVGGGLLLPLALLVLARRRRNNRG